MQTTQGVSAKCGGTSRHLLFPFSLLTETFLLPLSSLPLSSLPIFLPYIHQGGKGVGSQDRRMTGDEETGCGGV